MRRTDHQLFLKDGSPELLEEVDVHTNSLHHQAVPAEEAERKYDFIAYAKDGIVEIVRSLDRRLLGVQWHPEMMLYRGNTDALPALRLYKKLFNSMF